MRRNALIVGLGLGSSAFLLSIGVAAQPASQDGDTIVWTGEGEGLEPPRLWDCSRIAPEYRAWLEADNAPQDWKFAGKTYREAGDERSYDWSEWLNWYERSCALGAPLAEGSAAGSGGNGLGIAANVAALGGFVALSSGSDEERQAATPPNDSPG